MPLISKFKCFNMVTRINKSKTLAIHISCESKCRLDDKKCNLNQRWNNNKCLFDCQNARKHHVRETDYVACACTCKKSKYSEIINRDLGVMKLQSQ